MHTLPARRSLRLAGLPSGQHTLSVKLVFDTSRKRAVSKTLRVHFGVC